MSLTKTYPGAVRKEDCELAERLEAEHKLAENRSRPGAAWPVKLEAGQRIQDYNMADYVANLKPTHVPEREIAVPLGLPTAGGPSPELLDSLKQSPKARQFMERILPKSWLRERYPEIYSEHQKQHHADHEGLSNKFLRSALILALAIVSVSAGLLVQHFEPKPFAPGVTLKLYPEGRKNAVQFCKQQPDAVGAAVMIVAVDGKGKDSGERYYAPCSLLLKGEK